jgi:hypothetical protein
MAYTSTAINYVKDFYLKAIGWIAAHPHKTFWLGLGATASRLVF